MTEEMTVRLASVKFRTTKSSPTITQQSGETEDTQFTGSGAIEPPYNPLKLAEIYEDSNALSQNVAAYETNVDGFGYVLEPVVDVHTPSGREAIRSDLERGGAEVGDDELGRRLVVIGKEAEAERVRLKNFLDYIGVGISFTSLRKRTRKDQEVTGNAYWELLRGDDGKIAKVIHVPSHTVRLMPLDEVPVAVTERQRLGVLGWEEIEIGRRFRRYVQSLESSGTFVFFKEFGDPRVVCRTTGAVYGSVEEMRSEQNEGPDAQPASEMIHFSIYSPASPYGVPRWVGALPSVLGSRSMEEVNLAYFDNKGVPPMAVLVSGGVMTQEAIDRLEDVLNKEIKGKSNFHKVLVLEATADPGTNVSPRIEMKPLMNAVLSDAVFQKYDERNIDKVGSSFRLPRLVRGDVRDFNKSTAWASIRFAEEQVFSGERDEFDFTFNRTILTDLGVVYWRFVSKGPTIRDPETVVAMLTALAKVSSLSPNEVRGVAAKVLGIELPRIEEDWANRPPAFTLAGRGYLPGEEGQPVTQAAADDLLGKLDELNADVRRLLTKVMDGIDDEDVRAFTASIARHMAEDDLDMTDFTGSGDVPDSDEGAGADAGRGEDSPLGPLGG